MATNVRRAALLIASILFALGAGAAHEITFSPRKGTPKGGTEVRFHSPSGFSSDTMVIFDWLLSPKVTRIDSQNIVAVTPPHAVDIVEVRLVEAGGSVTLAGEFVFEPELEPILIPIALDAVEGGRGTRWVSEISVYNDSDERVSIDPQICYFIGSPRLCSTPARWVEPHSSLAIHPRWSMVDHPEMRVWPPAESADRLHFSVRLHELSKNPDGPGVEIPVVRARDFTRLRVWLPSIPTSPAYRSTLRVYSENTRVTVRIRDDLSGQLLDEYRLERFVPLDVGTFGTFILHDLLSSPGIRLHERVRIEVQSEATHVPLPVWAMLSLTHNETQQVLLFTSQ